MDLGKSKQRFPIPKTLLEPLLFRVPDAERHLDLLIASLERVALAPRELASRMAANTIGRARATLAALLRALRAPIDALRALLGEAALQIPLFWIAALREPRASFARSRARELEGARALWGLCRALFILCLSQLTNAAFVFAARLAAALILALSARLSRTQLAASPTPPMAADSREAAAASVASLQSQATPSSGSQPNQGVHSAASGLAGVVGADHSSTVDAAAPGPPNEPAAAPAPSRAHCAAAVGTDGCEQAEAEISCPSCTRSSSSSSSSVSAAQRSLEWHEWRWQVLSQLELLLLHDLPAHGRLGAESNTSAAAHARAHASALLQRALNHWFALSAAAGALAAARAFGGLVEMTARAEGRVHVALGRVLELLRGGGRGLDRLWQRASAVVRSVLKPMVLCAHLSGHGLMVMRMAVNDSWQATRTFVVRHGRGLVLLVCALNRLCTAAGACIMLVI
jgi:hypothetical protein